MNNIRSIFSPTLAWAPILRTVNLPAFSPSVANFINPALAYSPSIRPVVPLLIGPDDAFHFSHDITPATYPPVSRLTIVVNFNPAHPALASLNLDRSKPGAASVSFSVVPLFGQAYVSVGDVHRAVIRWMKTTEHKARKRGLQTGFLRRTEVAVAGSVFGQVRKWWFWEGLMSVGAGVDVLELVLPIAQID